MKIVYEVENSYGAIKDTCKTFFVGLQEDLIIKVEGADIGKCFVSIDNGNVSRKFSVESLDELTIPADLLKAGELKIRVAQFTRTKVRTINLEPITLINEDEGFTGHATFDDLKARVEALERKVDELEPLLKQMKDLYNALEQ